ncbi:unnamed protein product [Lota lota]
MCSAGHARGKRNRKAPADGTPAKEPLRAWGPQAGTRRFPQKQVESGERTLSQTTVATPESRKTKELRHVPAPRPGTPPSPQGPFGWHILRSLAVTRAGPCVPLHSQGRM